MGFFPPIFYLFIYFLLLRYSFKVKQTTLAHIGRALEHNRPGTAALTGVSVARHMESIWTCSDSTPTTTEPGAVLYILFWVTSHFHKDSLTAAIIHKRLDLFCWKKTYLMGLFICCLLCLHYLSICLHLDMCWKACRYQSCHLQQQRKWDFRLLGQISVREDSDKAINWGAVQIWVTSR